VVGAAVLGIGNGSFLGVDFALITQVLPEASANGRGMGLINIAASLPQIFSLGLAWLAVTHLGGYTVLFAGAAVIAILAAASVYRIRSVK
jgi:MFS family permease